MCSVCCCVRCVTVCSVCCRVLLGVVGSPRMKGHVGSAIAPTCCTMHGLRQTLLIQNENAPLVRWTISAAWDRPSGTRSQTFSTVSMQLTDCIYGICGVVSPRMEGHVGVYHRPNLKCTICGIRHGLIRMEKASKADDITYARISMEKATGHRAAIAAHWGAEKLLEQMQGTTTTRQTRQRDKRDKCCVCVSVCVCVSHWLA